MIKKYIVILIASLAVCNMARAQRSTSFIKSQVKAGLTYLRENQVAEDEKFFNHIDVGLTYSTSGLGFDLATPLGNWGQVRLGGVFRPFKTYTATFTLQMGEEVGVKISDERFQQLSEVMRTLTNTDPSREVVMQGDLNMNNFKCLMDIYPIQKHRNFHFTIGFFYGNSNLITANTETSYLKIQAAINTFNKIYKKALANESLVDIDELSKEVGVTIDGATAFQSIINRLRKWGSIKDANGNAITYTMPYMGDVITDRVTNRTFSVNGISVGVGKFAHNIVAQEDIYYDYSVALDEPYYVKDANGEWQEEKYARDGNGTEIKKGNIRYHKGDVIYKTGDDVRLTPDEDNMLTTTGVAQNSFKPYVGVGYTLPLTKDKKTCFSVDAGLMFWGGNPSVNIKLPIGVNVDNEMVYQSLDITEDVNSLPKSVQNYVSTIRKYPVFPEIGIRVSHRLW